MAAGLPTLSQIQAWDVDHLVDAAEHWNSSADRWDDVFGRVWQESLGMDWRGQARDALVERTTADKVLVAEESDRLREAALSARRGATDISALQRAVLYQVDDAHEAGFVVSEDLSVYDTRSFSDATVLAARQAQARALSADIRGRATQLLAADSEVGANLITAAGDVGSLTFHEKPVHHDGKISAVDWKQSPAPKPGPGPTGSDVHKAVKNLPRGTGDFIGEIRSERDLRTLWDWATQDSTPSTGSKYPGTERLLPDGTRIGMRASDEHGPTMEIRTPDKQYTKIHVNESRGGVPEIPTYPAPPVEAAPKQAAPVEGVPTEAAPREPSAPMGPAGLNPLPHFVEPPHSHRGPPIVGRDDVSDPEFESP